jgi:hypothetical protein
VPTQNLPAFAARLRAETDETRAKALALTHPAYTEHVESWRVQLDAFEGGGGFLDGGYLWPYPSESESDYLRRQKMARYHNYVEALIDLYVRFMFTVGVRRTSKNDEYNDWTEDVDGAGTNLSDFLKKLAAVALVTGHAGALVDKTPDEPTGPSRADEQARVFTTVFPSTAIVDWRFERNTLIAVKLKEAAPDLDLLSTIEADAAEQWLLWDREGWARFTSKGDLVSGDVPNLGLVPLVILRPKPSFLSPILGRALISNVNVVRALFNRASEEDEVLRTQAFSLLTVSVPADGDVKHAREQIGNTVGTQRAIVVQGDIDYKTPDQHVAGAIRENISYLVQEIYRAAHMRFTRDSLAAETAEAIRLQHTELNEMLQGFAKALGQAEKDIAHAYFAWSSPTPEAAQQAFEAAQVEAVYPDEFFLGALLTELDAWTEAIRLDLGDTMARRIKKKAARRVDTEMPEDVLAIVDAEIDALPPERLTAALPMDTGRAALVEEPPGVAA